MAVPSGPVRASTDAERAMFDFVDAYDRAYETAAAQHGLSVAQACVLGRIADPRGMRELADELGCDASNVTQIIARLESRDLVRRHTNPSDRRSRQIVRTGTGDALYADFETSFAFARAAIANLTLEEQDQLATLLRKALA
ncbi:MarR family winged helix-turn-helix transcriptional regulator [Dactylosporangium siamense]|uniref:DNA-binding protein n=1 Tax=Dactylosporangium siamense TaxID=685454 RepID=A0A919PJQ7_9ACTN|nr:MarR family winged helix-turn-helix transcriptional regulator [Dactylosporangium siamense]GIG45412.1 DNA-binding protein [Dactylosporangium siamense]